MRKMIIFFLGILFLILLSLAFYNIKQSINTIRQDQIYIIKDQITQLSYIQDLMDRQSILFQDAIRGYK